MTESTAKQSAPMSPGAYEAASARQTDAFTINGLNEAEQRAVRDQQRAVTFGGDTPASKAFAAQKQAQTALRRHVEGMVAKANSGQFTPEGLAAIRKGFETGSVAEALETVDRMARQLVADAEAQVAQITASMRPDETDSAAQIHASRFWSRTQRELDAIDTPGAAIAAVRRVLASASPNEQLVLSEELPSYLRSRQMSDEIVGRLLDEVAPALADARRRQTKAEQSRQVLAHNNAALRRAIASGNATVSLVDPTRYDPAR